MAFTDAEIDEMFEGYLQRKAVKSSTRGRKKKKAIAPQEDDYESMSLAEFSGQLSDSMGDCTELTVNSFFDMARENEKGNKLNAAKHAATGVVGGALLVYGLIEIFGAAMGGRD